MLEQLKELDNSILLTLNGSSSAYWDSVMWIITKTTTWIPLFLVLLYIVLKNSDLRRMLFVIVALAVTILLADRLSSGLIKPIVERWRPTHDATFLHTIDVVRGYTGGQFGFVSSHAANTFSIFVFVSLLLRSQIASVCLFLWACISSYSRIYLGVHFPGDILCGALLGMLVGLFVYFLYSFILKRMEGERQYFSTAYTPTGFQRTDMNLFAFALTLTYCIVLIAAIPMSV